MSDKSLLEWAAKAAGVEFFVVDGIEATRNSLGFQIPWNPLTDDGDALRLAVAVSKSLSSGLHIMPPDSDDPWAVVNDFDYNFVGRSALTTPCNGDDPCSSTRRAIVLFAAAIGKTKP